LVTSEILSSDVPGLNVGSRDQLFYLATSRQGGSGNLVTIRYFFLYRCTDTNTTALPYAAQTSGNQNVKYTGNFDSQAPIVFPPATNPFGITKTASSTTLLDGGTVTYEVTVTNSSTFDALIDTITDVLPPGVTYGGLVSGSGVTAANSSSIPSVGETGTITWIGIPFTTYMIPAGGSIQVRYTANLPDTPGSYTNSVTGISGLSNAGTATATVEVGENQNTPNVLLVKRITAINSTQFTDLIDGVDDINSPNYVPPPNDADDNHPHWPANYLQGRLNGGNISPGDELEYTIYFLSAGNTTAQNVLMCDRLHYNTTFIPDTFNDSQPPPDRGILLSYNAQSLALTNIEDSDAGQYFPPGIEPTDVYPNINCGGPNTNGTIVVNLGNIPHSTSAGQPSDSYGFIRFRVRVN
jgi:uncharacterized repeat protein (TIGR01451 family)